MEKLNRDSKTLKISLKKLLYPVYFFTFAKI